MAPRVRFAPSPTGMFHVGSARSALYNWLFARHNDGVFILHIEDTDEARNRPEWTQGIVSAMRWLGLDWDEGPLFQSAAAVRHLQAADQLYRSGRAYYCDCTAEVREARAKVGIGPPGYDGFCRDRGLGPGPGRALRFRIPSGHTTVHDLIRGDVDFDHATGLGGDFVIVKANGGAIFYLANTVDDLDMNITHVIRGEEHLPNTPKGLLLWEALAGERPPPLFAHLPLLVNEQRKKLSKRRDKVALESFRDEGYLADAMRNYLCLLGWSPGADREFLSLDEMIAEFRLEEVNNSPAFFDVRKLTAFNEHYVSLLDDAEFVEACLPFLRNGGRPWTPWPWEPEDLDTDIFARMAPHVRARTKVLTDVPGMVDFLFRAQPAEDPDAWEKGLVKVEHAAEILAECGDVYRTCPWEASVLQQRTLGIGLAHGLRRSAASMPVRVAVTGKTIGPPLFESLEVLGRDVTVARVDAALRRLRTS